MQGMIAHRLSVAGAKIAEKRSKPGEKRDDPLPDLSAFLTDDAVLEVFKITKGVPRDVCIFLSALFLDGFVRDQKPVDYDLVKATLAEMARMKKWPVKVAEAPEK